MRGRTSDTRSERGPETRRRSRGGRGAAVAALLLSLLVPGAVSGTGSESGATASAPRIATPLTDDAMTRPVGQLGFGGLLPRSRFERPHWHSFDHVRPRLAPSTRASDTTRFTVVIDPGHGGIDPGTRGPNGLLEKHLTLDIAHRVQLFLSELDDIRVVLTRQHDHGLSRHARVRAVRESEADLFVSLHFNHLPQSEITLVESYYAGPENVIESLHTLGVNGLDTTFTQGSVRFAAHVQRRVFDAVSFDNERAIDAGVKRDTLFMLTRSLTSGVLVELTCLSNAEEAERLRQPRYRDRIAAALSDAIREYRDELGTYSLDG